MTRQPFKSKNIKSAGYHPETGEIEVEFRKGKKLYRYGDCSEKTWKAFSTYRSPGQYLNTFLRRKKCRTIESEP
jgi:hypothetical protein